MRIDPVPPIQIEPIPNTLVTHQPKPAPKKRLTKQQRKVAITTCLVVVFCLWLVSKELVSDAYTVMSYRGDPRLVQMAGDSGMNLNGKALFLSKDPELVDANTLQAHCPTEDMESIEYGCYDSSKDKIYILKIDAQPYSEISLTTIAHEMLHVAWDQLDYEEKQSIGLALSEHVASQTDQGTAAVKESLQNYPDDEEIRINEMHSFIGAEVANGYTDDVLDVYFQQYFTDRSLSANANIRFEQGLASIEKNFVERKDQIRNLEDDLNAYQAKWLDPIEYYMRQNVYYGDTYTYNKNVDAYNNNLKNYKSKYAAYESYVDQYNSDIERYNSAIASLKPDKKQNAAILQES